MQFQWIDRTWKEIKKVQKDYWLNYVLNVVCCWWIHSLIFLHLQQTCIVVEERIINAVLSFIASGKIKIFIYDFIGAEWIVSHIITRRVYLNRAHWCNRMENPNLETPAVLSTFLLSFWINCLPKLYFL